MSTRKRIAILFHKTTTDRRMRTYRIWYCAQVWEKMGIEVKILRGPNARIEADVAIAHVDLSVRPEEYRRLLDTAPVVVNRNMVDIRKSTFSRNLVSPDDDYDGPVIVKTDDNCGGQPERSILRRQPVHRRFAQKYRHLAEALRRVTSSGSVSRLAYTKTLRPAEYPIFEAKHLVPKGVFENPDLVVEKFVPEIDDGLYCIRYYTFLGDNGVAVRLKSDTPHVKVGNSGVLEEIPVDERMVAIRRELGVDYGKMDYVIHDGEPVLLDVNTTPAIADPLLPMKMAHTAHIARGIYQWLPELER